MTDPVTPDSASPTVSVALPTYGRPALLERAIESVLEQTYDDIELVVVDDHSPDPADTVVRQFDDGTTVDIRCLRHDENRGANAARNTGIRAASGEYVAFLDDDDQWEPTKVERQVEAFQAADDDVGVVYTGMAYVDNDGERTSTRLSTTRGDVTADIFAGAPLNPFSCVMVRADVIEQAGLPDTAMPSWQDREWYVRLSQHCRFEVITEPLVVRQWGDHEQISDDFESKRDVSYPLLLSKHRETAAEYGAACERQFVASLSETLARAAVKNSYYRDAITYSLKSIYYAPTQTGPYLYLLASLGGDVTFKPASLLYRLLSGTSSPVDD